MESCLDTEEVALATPKMQVTKNIEYVIKELETFSKPTSRINSTPTYKTLFSLTLDTFYDRFGSEKTSLFKLTQTHHLESLPQLCIIHAIPELNAHQDCASLIEDKIFISHKYFKNWLMTEDKDLFETEILELILSKLDVNTHTQSN